MLVTLFANNWFINILAAFFISLLDTVAYLLLAAGYNIFYAVSQIDIFGTPDGQSIYEDITKKIYAAISVVMLFVFAYYLIMMIVDPDGNSGKTTSTLVKETIIAFVTVILLPTVFSYMSLFQKHVITNNTIGNLILGGSGGNNGNYGKSVSMIVFTSFYHPDGTTYSDYFNNDGEYIGQSEAQSVCEGGGANPEICSSWAEGLQEWYDDDQLLAVDAISKRSKLYNATNDEGGMYYMWILSTVAGVAAAWFFFSYAIDLGTRAVKLAFLQLIAPVPVLIKIFPQGKKTFDSWFAEIKKTYLDVFLRLAVIFFIVKLCTLVPTFIVAAFSGTSTVPGGIVTKALATVCLILGLLKFAKDAPTLFKTLFASGGGLFAGLDWKPGMKRRISENEYAMKGIGGAIGLGAGGLGAGVMAFRNAYKDADPKGNVGRGKAIGLGLLSGARGFVRGATAGATNGVRNAPTEFSRSGLTTAASSGVSSGQASEIKASNKRERYGGLAHPIHSIATHASEAGENFVEGWHNVGNTLSGANVGNAAVETIKVANGTIDSYLGLAESAVKPYDEAFKDLQKKAIKEGFTEYNGVKYYADSNAEMVEKMETQRRVSDMFKTAAKGANGYYINPETGREDKNYTQQSVLDKELSKIGNISDLKKSFERTKNEKIAEKVTGTFKDGAATYMANLNKQLSKEIGNLGSEQVSKLNDIIRKANLTHAGNQVKDVSDFLAKLSDTNPNNIRDITATDIATLKDIKDSMAGLSKNIVVTQQAQAANKQQEKKDNK